MPTISIDPNTAGKTISIFLIAILPALAIIFGFKIIEIIAIKCTKEQTTQKILTLILKFIFVFLIALYLLTK